MLANVHATLCYVLGTSKQKHGKNWKKTCLTEEALAPIDGSRSKYSFLLSRQRSGGTVYRVHHHRGKVQQGLSHQNAPAQSGGEAMVARTTLQAQGERRFSLLKVCSKT